MRSMRRVAIVAAAVAVLSTLPALPAMAGPEGSFVSRINASRAASGLPPLAVHADLVDDARAHSNRMMADGSIYHNPNLGSVTTGWDRLGENVGVGPSVDQLHDAFMSSSGHRANILGDFNYVGVGVAVESDTKIWVTVVFMLKGSTTTSTTTTTTTVPAEPPPATTTTTTVPAEPPPATTTTTTAAPRARPIAASVVAAVPRPAVESYGRAAFRPIAI